MRLSVDGVSFFLAQQHSISPELLLIVGWRERVAWSKEEGPPLDFRLAFTSDAGAKQV